MKITLNGQSTWSKEDSVPAVRATVTMVYEFKLDSDIIGVLQGHIDRNAFNGIDSVMRLAEVIADTDTVVDVIQALELTNIADKDLKALDLKIEEV